MVMLDLEVVSVKMFWLILELTMMNFGGGHQAGGPLGVTAIGVMAHGVTDHGVMAHGGTAPGVMAHGGTAHGVMAHGVVLHIMANGDPSSCRN